MAVSFEKRLMILPSGLEVKKLIGALEIRLSIELWRRLLRLSKVKVIRIVVNPLRMRAPTEIITKLAFIKEVICDVLDTLTQSETMNRT